MATSGSIGTAYFKVAPDLSGVQGKISSGLRGTGSSFADQFGGEVSKKSAVIVGAIAGVASAAASKAMSLVGSSVGDAVSRVDTLARFPTVMANLGYSAKEASKEVKRIATSLIGLPTSLDSLTTFVQRIAPVSGSLKNATNIALAFNNAVLAGGGPVYRQADAIEQFSQMLAKGKPDLMAWRTLQEAMPATLSQIAKQLGITTGNTQELYEQLQNGTISFEDFTGAVVSLNDKGLPGFKNFADQAKDATKGIATGFQNMKTAITRGLANIIDAIGQANISSALSSIGKAFESVLKVIASAIPPIVQALENFFGVVSRNRDIFGPIAAGIAGVVTALIAYNIYVAIATALTAAYMAVSRGMSTVLALQVQGLTRARAAWVAFSVVLAVNPIVLAVTAIAALTAGLAYFFTQTAAGRVAFAKITQTLKPLTDNFKILAGFVGGQLTSAFRSLVRIFSQMQTELAPVTASVTKFVKTMLQNKTVVTVLKAVGLALAAIVAGPIIPFLAAVVVGITVLSKVLGFLADHFTIVKIVLGTVFAPLVAAVAVAIISVKAIIAVVRTLVAVFTAVFNVISTVVSTAFNAMVVAWQSVLYPVFSVIISILGTVLGVFVKIWAAIALVVLGTMAIIAGFIYNRMQAIWQNITTIWNAIYPVISAVLGFISDVIVRNWNFYYGVISTILGAIFGVIRSVWNATFGFLAGVFSIISSLVVAAWNGIYNHISGIVRNIWNAVTSTFNSVVGFVGSIGGRILGQLGNFGGLLYNSGRALIQGLLNGAGSLLSSVGSFFLSRLPGWIQGPFKKALGIASPSKVFAGYGKNTIEGYVNAVKKGQGSVESAMSDLADSAMDGFNAGGITSGVMANASPSTATPYTNTTQSGDTTTQDVSIGQVVIQTPEAAQEFFKQLNQDTINAGMGLSLNQGAN